MLKYEGIANAVKKINKRYVGAWIGTIVLLLFGVGLYLCLYRYYVHSITAWVAIGSSVYFALLLVVCGRLWGVVKHKKIESLLCNIVYFCVFVLFAFLIEESIWNTEFKNIPWKTFLYDYILIAIVTMSLVLIIRKTWLVYTVVLLFHWAWGVANYYVMEFKGHPPLFSDFVAVRTAASVMKGYAYDLTNSILYCSMAVCVALIFMTFLPPGDFVIRTQDKRKRWICHVMRFVIPVVLCIVTFRYDAAGTLAEDIYYWSPTDTFEENGAPATVLISARDFFPDKPKGYSAKEVTGILQTYETADTETEAETETAESENPLVIVIMNESFSDLSVLGSFASDDYLAYWNSVDDYVMRGNLYVSVCGGGTCNTEYEFLTGNSMEQIVYPYQCYDLSDAFNLVDYLKDQQGYQTVAFHPENGKNWNREKVYSDFGFDLFYTIDDVASENRVAVNGSQLSDLYDYNTLEEIIAESDEEEPLFIFNVTMQNHASYKTLNDGYETVSIESAYAGYTDVINYLTLIRESDRAYESLISYLRKLDRPVVLCMFGDHQPALDENFIGEVFSYEGDSAVEASEQRYITPYMIWSNYDTGISQANVDMSANYLGANLMNVLGYHTAYTDYLLDLQKELPVVNFVGYQTNDGIWHSKEESNDRLEEYRKVQYYELFAKKK